MALDLRVTGGAEARRLAAIVARERAAKPRHINNALRRGAKVLEKTIPAEALRRLPSGYGPTMARSVRVKTSVQLTRGNGITVRVYAIGRTKERDVARINAGELRHPFFGKRTRILPDGREVSGWYTTHVRRDFVTDPFNAAAPPILHEIDQAYDAMTERIERG